MHHCIFCNHLYWFLFSSYRGVVFVLVVLVMTRLSSPKTVFVCVFYCVFGVGDFISSTLWKAIPIIFKISFSCFQYFQGYLLSSSFQQNWYHFIRTSFAKDIVFPVFNRKVLPFIIWFHPPLLNNDVSLHNLVVLIVVIPTSPSLSKTEFVCKTYCFYTIGLFLRQKVKRERKKRQPGRAGRGRLPRVASRPTRVRLTGPGREIGRAHV